jgi:hypothetical protein
MLSGPENFLPDEEAGMTEADFAAAQKDRDHQADYYPARSAKWEREKGGTYYIQFLFSDKKTRKDLIDFINKGYGQNYPVKAAEDLRYEDKVKIDFNNSAHEQKNVLLQILAQNGWQATGEKQYFVDRVYEPAPLAGSSAEKPKPKLGVIKGGRKAEPADKTWQGKEAA